MKDINRKFVISVIAVLVIILATNDFMDFSGETVTKKTVQRTTIPTCYDSDIGYKINNGGWDINKAGYASDGSRTYYDRCFSTGTLMEAFCRGGNAFIESATCLKGCRNNVCKR